MNGVTVLVPGGSALVISTADDSLTVGATVKGGVRPEKIRLEALNGAPPADGWNSVSGLLRVASYVGVSHQYTIDGPEGRTLTVYAQNLGAERPPAPGDEVRLSWRPEHTFVVPPDDEPIEEEDEA